MVTVMVTVNLDQCAGCGLCMDRFRGFCIACENGKPKIDYAVCNGCQKCIAICPNRAIWMNGQPPERIGEPLSFKSADLKELLRRRRSIKAFKQERIPRVVLQEIAAAASFAPSQNKNIEIIAVDDAEMLSQIDRIAMRYVRRLHRRLFAFPPLTAFFRLFSPSLGALKRKMEWDLFTLRRVIKPNTSALFVAVGDARMPVTKGSAPYVLATMLLYAESLGVGSCLMDALTLAINASAEARRLLGIPRGLRALGVLAVGYSDEHIVNIPRGYEMKVGWNGRATESH